jgi:hypothetical protein
MSKLFQVIAFLVVITIGTTAFGQSCGSSCGTRYFVRSRACSPASQCTPQRAYYSTQCFPQLRNVPSAIDTDDEESTPKNSVKTKEMPSPAILPNLPIQPKPKIIVPPNPLQQNRITKVIINGESYGVLPDGGYAKINDGTFQRMSSQQYHFVNK